MHRPTRAVKAEPVEAEPFELVTPEPDFLRQSAEEMTAAEQGAWFTRAGRDFVRAGAKHVRYTVHPDMPNLRLAEGWREHPGSEGEPRWQEVDG